jgi:hypothetical protein
MYDDLFIGRVSVFVTPCLVCLFLDYHAVVGYIGWGWEEFHTVVTQKNIQCEEYKGGIFFFGKNVPKSPYSEGKKF